MKGVGLNRRDLSPHSACLFANGRVFVSVGGGNRALIGRVLAFQWGVREFFSTLVQVQELASGLGLGFMLGLGFRLGLGTSSTGTSVEKAFANGAWSVNTLVNKCCSKSEEINYHHVLYL